jgi:hypothetical protein
LCLRGDLALAEPIMGKGRKDRPSGPNELSKEFTAAPQARRSYRAGKSLKVSGNYPNIALFEINCQDFVVYRKSR